MPAGGSGARTPRVLEATVKELLFVPGVMALSNSLRPHGLQACQRSEAHV